MAYNWQQKNWPNFSYNLDEIEHDLYSFAERIGYASGLLKALPPQTQLETIIDVIVAEAIKTSEIEGEYLSRKDVMSSVKNNLGLNKVNENVQDKKAAGIGELMLSVRNTFQEELSQEQLFAWHRMLLPNERDINVGAWRNHDEPMQVISGAMGKEKIHFEAPPSQQVSAEMEQFINWFNSSLISSQQQIKNAPVRTAIAHLYFESIHPFEDGNGRIGRAIAEKALSQGIGRPILLSLSKSIEADKKAYYHELETAQQSNNITRWLKYFIGVIATAQTDAENQIEFTLKKARFFDRINNKLNERQLKVINRMLEEGPDGFTGGMNASKYGSLTKTSKATATRDLQDLLTKDVVVLLGAGGRSTKYQLNLL